MFCAGEEPVETDVPSADTWWKYRDDCILKVSWLEDVTR